MPYLAPLPSRLIPQDAADLDFSFPLNVIGPGQPISEDGGAWSVLAWNNAHRKRIMPHGTYGDAQRAQYVHEIGGSGCSFSEGQSAIYAEKLVGNTSIPGVGWTQSDIKQYTVLTIARPITVGATITYHSQNFTELALQTLSSGRVYTRHRDNGGNYFPIETPTGVAQVGKEMRIAIVLDLDALRWEMFINGQRFTSASGALNPSWPLIYSSAVTSDTPGFPGLGYKGPIGLVAKTQGADFDAARYWTINPGALWKQQVFRRYFLQAAGASFTEASAAFGVGLSQGSTPQAVATGIVSFGVGAAGGLGNTQALVATSDMTQGLSLTSTGTFATQESVALTIGSETTMVPLVSVLGPVSFGEGFNLGLAADTGAPSTDGAVAFGVGYTAALSASRSLVASFLSAYGLQQTALGNQFIYAAVSMGIGLLNTMVGSMMTEAAAAAGFGLATTQTPQIKMEGTLSATYGMVQGSVPQLLVNGSLSYTLGLAQELPAPGLSITVPVSFSFGLEGSGISGGQDTASADMAFRFGFSVQAISLDGVWAPEEGSTDIWVPQNPSDSTWS